MLSNQQLEAQQDILPKPPKAGEDCGRSEAALIQFGVIPSMQ